MKKLFSQTRIYISKERSTAGNDVNNLAKLVHYALKAVGAIINDPFVLNLDVTEFHATENLNRDSYPGGRTVKNENKRMHIVKYLGRLVFFKFW